MMTVGELIEILEIVSPDAQMRLAHQPGWAFEFSIGPVAQVRGHDSPIVYIGQGNQLGYLNEEATRELGSSRAVRCLRQCRTTPWPDGLQALTTVKLGAISICTSSLSIIRCTCIPP
jgi:hypothetical protein